MTDDSTRVKQWLESFSTREHSVVNAVPEFIALGCLHPEGKSGKFHHRKRAAPRERLHIRQAQLFRERLCMSVIEPPPKPLFPRPMRPGEAARRARREEMERRRRQAIPTKLGSAPPSAGGGCSLKCASNNRRFCCLLHERKRPREVSRHF